MEIKMIKNIILDENGRYKTKCVKCGREIELEPTENDWEECCGIDYTLEVQIIDLVVENNE